MLSFEWDGSWYARARTVLGFARHGRTFRCRPDVSPHDQSSLLPTEGVMALSAPTRPVWVISIVLAAIAVVGRLVHIPYVTGYAGFWLGAAFLLLLIGVTYKGV